MKAAMTLPLAATIAFAVAGSALAGPQSMLDPYAHIQAPRDKSDTIHNLYKKPKKSKVKVPKTETVTIQEDPREAPRSSSSSASAGANAGSSDGVVGGTKQIMQGISSATKGMATGVTKPAKVMGDGVVKGTKKIGSGVMSSGGFIAGGAKAIGNGMKAGATKLKDGTVAAGSKAWDGAEAAGHAVAAIPVAATKKITGGSKSVADKTTKPADEKVAASNDKDASPERIGDESKGSEKIESKPTEKIAETKSASGGIGSKIVGMPKAVGHGIFGAASKTTVATKNGAKKVASVPLSVGKKLNPFHKEKSGAENLEIAQPVPKDEADKPL